MERLPLPYHLARRVTLRCRRGGFLRIWQGWKVAIWPQGSPRPAFDGGRRTSPAPFGARSEELKILLGRASISEEHRALMGTVIERISSAESGLHEAVKSLLTGFEVR